MAIGSLTLSGAELTFVIFPMALSLMPFSNLWAITFYLMMICLGLDSMFGFIELVSTVVEEYIPGKREFIRFIICFVFCILGIPYCMGNGF